MKNKQVLLLKIAGILLCACLVAFVYFTIDRQKQASEAKKARLQQYDNARKVEQVIGIPFPTFTVTKATEKDLNDDEYYLPRYICKVEAEFNPLPSEHFYQKLDSLCELEGTLWKKKENMYVYDSIAGQVSLSELVLSLILEKGEKSLMIEYDVMNLK